MKKDLVMYTRTSGCPSVNLAKRVLNEHKIDYREVFIDEDDTALERLESWTGFRSIPTLLVANAGEVIPYKEPAYLETGASPRGVNRGVMISEPNIDQFKQWLEEHNFLERQNNGV